MAPRITIIGGGSYQWAPKLLVDVANTPLLHDAEIVIEDIDPAPLPRMVELVEHIAERPRHRHRPRRAPPTSAHALEGADYVVVNISTGGFESMRHDLEIPARYGIMQSVGDTVGPGGIIRALRNIPVFLELARDMEELCPDAWMFNLTNPMTTICRAVTRETGDQDGRALPRDHDHAVRAEPAARRELPRSDSRRSPGVNHLPVHHRARRRGRDGLELLRELLETPIAAPPSRWRWSIPRPRPREDLRGRRLDEGRPHAPQPGEARAVPRFGVLPGAGDRHLVEFFPGFLTEESGWGERWGVHLTTIEERERWQGRHIADSSRRCSPPTTVSSMPSGEMVAPVIQCLELDQPGWFPLNIPNEGQVAGPARRA